MSSSPKLPIDDPELLAREVLALREQVVDMQRQMARYGVGGEQRYIAGMEVSISEREELLLEAERIAHMGSWVWDVESGAVSWSDELFRILGYDPTTDAPSIDAYFATVHPDDRERVTLASKRIAETGVAAQVFYRVLRKDGSVRHVQTHGAVLFDAAGKLRRIVGTILDISESHRAALELEHALHQLQDAQQFARLGSWYYDVAADRLNWSPEMFRILGVHPDTAPSRERFLQLVHPEDLARVRAHVERLAVPEPGADAFADAPIDARIVRPDGEVRHVRLRSRLERGLDGRVAWRRGVVQDVTDATLLQRRLAHAEKMETIGRLAGGVAHEINNSMMVVHAGVELLAPNRPPDPEILAQIKDAVASTRDLTSRLLAFGRQSTLRLQRVHPNRIVEDTVRLVHRLLGERVTLALDLGRDVPYARLDPHLTGQALINLLINARDAMQDGGRIVVSTRCVVESGVAFVELGVRDTGPGVAPELRDKIFEPFFTTKHEGQGTGLGLAMVQGAVEQQGGGVSFESGPGGSLFVLRFAADERAEGGGALLGERATRPSGRRLRILVVEDQESVATLVTRLLERAGHEVKVALLPSAALAIYREQAPRIDLIISDVLMPEMAGTELVERLATLGALPPVLFMSGFGADAIRATTTSDRVVLGKPFTSQELFAAIERALG